MIEQPVTKKIIKKLINGEDYRTEIVSLINEEFLNYAIEFFKRVVIAKISNGSITIDWYKKEFLNSDNSKEDIAVNAGLNMKTISNMYNSATKNIVLDVSAKYFDNLYNDIEQLVKSAPEIDMTLTLKLKGVSVDLSINETLIVINTLAVKRAALRGGAWSSAGKRVEKPLMLVLCKLFDVDSGNYSIKSKGKAKTQGYEREIDFYLQDDNKNVYYCEVKLMGQGNPESADATIARQSAVFIGDKLSETNKKQLDDLNIKWVMLRETENNTNGYKKFGKILNELGIKCLTDPKIKELDKIIDEVFNNLKSMQ